MVKNPKKRLYIFILLGIFCLSALDIVANQYLKINPKWSYSLQGGLKSLKTTDSSSVYIQTSKELVSYNSDGTQLWKFKPSVGEIKSYIVEDNDIIYVQTINSLYSLNWDGSERWSFQANSSEDIKKFEFSNDGSIFVLTSTEFYSLDPVDGEEYWHFSQDSETKSFKILEDGMIYVATSDKVYAFDSFDID